MKSQPTTDNNNNNNNKNHKKWQKQQRTTKKKLGEVENFSFATSKYLRNATQLLGFFFCF